MRYSSVINKHTHNILYVRLDAKSCERVKTEASRLGLLPEDIVRVAIEAELAGTNSRAFERSPAWPHAPSRRQHSKTLHR